MRQEKFPSKWLYLQCNSANKLLFCCFILQICLMCSHCTSATVREHVKLCTNNTNPCSYLCVLVVVRQLLGPFYHCQISCVAPLRSPRCFSHLANLSEFTEQHRPKGYICANITFQWKLPVSYSGPLWWIELQSGAADCVLICSTCSLWRLLEKAARPIKQTWRAGAG